MSTASDDPELLVSRARAGAPPPAPPARPRGGPRPAAAATLTLNRPHRRNALTWDGTAALARALAELADDDTCRAAVLTGAGSAFCSGGDVADQQRRSTTEVVDGDALAPIRSSIEAIWSFPKPLVAAVNGDAVGAGAGLALLCDFRVMARRARMIFAFARVGLSPDFGTSWTLPRLAGRGQAARMLMTAAPVHAADCLAFGLVELVVDDETCRAEAAKAVEAVADNSPVALAATKRVLRHTDASTFGDGLDTEFQEQLSCRRSDDHREGTAAFLEKRRPRFTGRPAPATTHTEG